LVFPNGQYLRHKFKNDENFAGGESLLAFPQVFYGYHFGKNKKIRTVV